MTESFVREVSRNILGMPLRCSCKRLFADALTGVTGPANGALISTKFIRIKSEYDMYIGFGRELVSTKRIGFNQFFLAVPLQVP